MPGKTFAQALLELTCTSCGHPVHHDTEEELGCKYGKDNQRDGSRCQCPRATISGEDILKLVREFEPPADLVESLDYSNMVISTPDDLLMFHRWCAARGQKLMGLKNHDYAGYSAQGMDIDTMKNFRGHEEFGIVVRMGDKLKRMENFCRTGKLLVQDESIIDTAIDIFNYAVLFLAYSRERRTRLLRGEAEKLVLIQNENKLVRLEHDQLPEKVRNMVPPAGWKILQETGRRNVIREAYAKPEVARCRVIHDLGTGHYIRLDEDGCVTYPLKVGEFVIALKFDPNYHQVMAEFVLDEHTSKIQFSVGNPPEVKI